MLESIKQTIDKKIKYSGEILTNFLTRGKYDVANQSLDNLTNAIAELKTKLEIGKSTNRSKLTDMQRSRVEKNLMAAQEMQRVASMEIQTGLNALKFLRKSKRVNVISALRSASIHFNIIKSTLNSENNVVVAKEKVDELCSEVRDEVRNLVLHLQSKYPEISPRLIKDIINDSTSTSMNGFCEHWMAMNKKNGVGEGLTKDDIALMHRKKDDWLVSARKQLESEIGQRLRNRNTIDKKSPKSSMNQQDMQNLKVMQQASTEQIQKQQDYYTTSTIIINEVNNPNIRTQRKIVISNSRSFANNGKNEIRPFNRRS